MSPKKSVIDSPLECPIFLQSIVAAAFGGFDDSDNDDGSGGGRGYIANDKRRHAAPPKTAITTRRRYRDVRRCLASRELAARAKISPQINLPSEHVYVKRESLQNRVKSSAGSGSLPRVNTRADVDTARSDERRMLNFYNV